MAASRAEGYRTEPNAGSDLASLADRVPALPHLDRECWLAAVFRPIGHRLTMSEARRARAEHA
jgi:hypothetical protein